MKKINFYYGNGKAILPINGGEAVVTATGHLHFHLDNVGGTVLSDIDADSIEAFKSCIATLKAEKRAIVGSRMSWIVDKKGDVLVKYSFNNYGYKLLKRFDYKISDKDKKNLDKFYRNLYLQNTMEDRFCKAGKEAVRIYQTLSDNGIDVYPLDCVVTLEDIEKNFNKSVALTNKEKKNLFKGNHR